MPGDSAVRHNTLHAIDEYAALHKTICAQAEIERFGLEYAARKRNISPENLVVEALANANEIILTLMESRRKAEYQLAARTFVFPQHIVIPPPVYAMKWEQRAGMVYFLRLRHEPQYVKVGQTASSIKSRIMDFERRYAEVDFLFAIKTHMAFLLEQYILGAMSALKAEGYGNETIAITGDQLNQLRQVKTVNKCEVRHVYA